MGPEGRANTMIGVSAAYLAVAWIAFSLRTIVKGRIMRSFGLDDWLMVITMLVFTVDSGLLIAIGRGLKDVEHASIYVTYQVFQFAFYTLANVFLKASLAITFNRILLERWQRRTVQVTVGIHTAFGLATFFTIIFRCGNPMDFYARFHHSMCISWDAMQGVQYTNSVINTIADWVLALLPIFALRNMKMNHQAKVSAGFILVLGCVSSIMSMPRFGFIHGLGGMGNKFWTMAYPVAVLSVAEVGTGATAACLLTLRPLIRSLRERSEHSRSSDTYKMDDMEEAEVGQAKAVSLKSVSATSISDSNKDSVHKVKSVPAMVVVGTTELDTTSQALSVDTSQLRRRSSCKPMDELTLHEDNFSIDEPISEQSDEDQPQSDDADQPQKPNLTHRMTEDSDVRPWRQATTIDTAKQAKDKKRLTWTDIHAQWSGAHSARTACHGPVNNKEANKPKRISIKRVSRILAEWSWDKA
ncbi:hypothetical protein QM012_001695 [Aureobasidium pullulans]|uniref:Rhodopsin domain-containing protein n=1 Tax=Aureobasidium pullulans TaxID=5580 RepID=A0ABR0TC89_AURPU